ncbi:VOC family protein [Pseudomonas sp. BN415]|uniref:VOC family protein n=1 Tax=Pseudomonas sp. BN415 TaxID=2567889 RepID=UPI002458BACB|nr:VOC family protein [Pseudomonas sp. BN415]MDH4580743.1 VOC family protein [Pseudomonas sp. BN415]
MSKIFGKIAQNGYVVKDIKAAMDHWINVLGVGPWFYIEEVPTDYFRHRGVDSGMKFSAALANSGDLQIELIQQLNDEPSMYKEFLDAGNEGMQHVAYWVTNYDEVYNNALAAGLKVGHEGQIGGPQGRFSYFDTELHQGTVVELSDISGQKGKYFEMIKEAALNWDGKDPIRKVG